MRALIVDDEPTVCLLLSRILVRDFACEASQASNGIEALDLLSRQTYDFVLLDLLMPVMSGMETLQAIRRDAHLHHLPVMVMSTVREEARVREAIQLGVGSYLTKPLRPGEAAARLHRFVSRLGASGALAPPTRSCLGLQHGARVLVVDDDPDFRVFVHGVLSPDYAVATAASGAQGLRMAMDSAPAMIILGPQLGAVRQPIFLEKLRAQPRLGMVPVVAAVSSRAAAQPSGIDASIHRTLVADSFRRQFDTLVRGTTPVTLRRTEPAAHASAAPDVRPEILPEVLPEILPEAPRDLPGRFDARPHLVTVATEVLHTNLGLEVDENQQGLVGIPGDHVAFVPLEMSQPGGSYRFLMRARGDAARHLARRARPNIEVDDALAVTSLQDLTWTLASRWLGAVRTDGVLGELGLPDVTTWAEPDASTDGTTVAEVGFEALAGDVRFSLALRLLPPDAVASRA